MKNVHLILLIGFLAAMSACSQQEQAEAGEENTTQEKSTISLTADQIAMAEITTGQASLKTLYEKIKVKGRVEASPQNRARVSAKMGGYIKQIFVHNGEDVRQGQALFTVEHEDFIELQKNYLQSKLRLAQQKRELERQQKLAEQDAGIQKILEEQTTLYEQQRVETASLAGKLRMFGVNPDNLSADKMATSLTVSAPIKGIIDEIMITTGEYIEPNQMAFELVNNDQFHLELQVFEKDIHKIQIGQSVNFSCNIASSQNSLHTAFIETIGNNLNPETKTFFVHAHPEKCKQKMRHGIYIDAYIHTSEMNKWAVPESAVIEQNGESFVFEATSDSTFATLKVTKGIADKDWVAIDSPEIQTKNIVISGANYLVTALE